MFELGEYHELPVAKKADHGVYLGDAEGDRVLLPRKYVPEGTELGDTIRVFIYCDSADRPIATTKEPLLIKGKLAILECVQTTQIGAFLNWGLEKDLFLPYKEQEYKVQPGDHILAALYTDKSGRLCATMKVYEYLSSAPPYQAEDWVSGTVYRVNPDLGTFVAVDNQYYGMIPKQELYQSLKVGQTVEARVLKVRPDGKLDLSPRKKAYKQMNEDADTVLQLIESYGGTLPFDDKADSEKIKRETGLSKSAFKRAVGRLLKEKKVILDNGRIIQQKE